MELDKDNIEFFNAVEFVNSTDKIFFLTGKAGTGKTTFLKYIREQTTKNTVILAPTGVAAINAGGVTINSFFQIPFGPFIPDDERLRTTAFGENRETIYSTFKYHPDKMQIINKLELLIIDEISMVRCDILDVVDRILRVFRKKTYLPFGGVQVILIGDPYQLPPIAESEQWDILSRFYKTTFFFSSKVIEQSTLLYIELKKIYRQSDVHFINLLNNVRDNNLSENDFTLLNSKYQPIFPDKNDYIILATHNRIVSETNLTKLNELATPLFKYSATITGVFPTGNRPTEEILNLKEGAQIMFVKNDIGEYKKYHNGKIGKIKVLEESKIIVQFENNEEIEVDKTIWENVSYKYNVEKKKIEQEVIGTFEQFPIKLAWSITVHKSQGLTFDKVIADLGAAFAPGQVYVALSRCTSLDGLVLKTQIFKNAVKTDPNVIEFAKNETSAILLLGEMNSGKADYLYKKSRTDFAKGNINNALDNFYKALKFRNDLETDVFKKFIIVNFNKFHTSRQLLKNILKENRDQEEVNHDEEIESNTSSELSKVLKQNSLDTLKFENKINEITIEKNNLKSENGESKLLLESQKRLIDKLKFDLFQKEQELDENSKKVQKVKVQPRKIDEYSIMQLALLLNVSTHRIYDLTQNLYISVFDNPNSKLSQESAKKIISKYFEEEIYKSKDTTIDILDSDKELENKYNKLLNEIKELKSSINISEKKGFFERIFSKK